MGLIRIHKDVLTRAYHEIEQAADELKTIHSAHAKRPASDALEHVTKAEHEIKDLLRSRMSSSKQDHLAIDNNKFREAYSHVVEALDVVSSIGLNDLNKAEHFLLACQNHLHNVPAEHHPGKHHTSGHSSHSGHHTPPPHPKPYHETHGKKPPHPPRPYHETHGTHEKEDEGEDHYAVADRTRGEGHRPAHYKAEDHKPPQLPPKRKGKK